MLQFVSWHDGIPGVRLTFYAADGKAALKRAKELWGCDVCVALV